MRPLACLLFLLLGVSAGAAAELELAGELAQGGLVWGRVPPGTAVRFLDRDVRVTPEGRFVIGFGRDAAPELSLSLRYPDGRREERMLAIVQRHYAVQRIDGLPPKMVTPDAAQLARIRREAALIAAVKARDTEATWFEAGFVWPVRGPISGVYGSQRILNGEPRRPHFGVDIAAPAGTPVLAPAGARVALAEPDLYFTGGTVMLDHGHGVTSVYSHLATVTAEAGAVVERGAVLGTVGATGRVTGAHLDWRLNWFDQPLDPALVAGPMPAPK